MGNNNTGANYFFYKNKLPVLKQLPIVIIDNIKTPENLGSIVRLAGNIGIKDIYVLNQKNNFRYSKVKATASNAFNNVNIVFKDNNFIDDINDYCFFIVETDKSAKNIFETDFPLKSAFIFGNEAHGVSNFLLQKVKNKIFIPMHGDTKSMNVAQSVGIVLFEWLRQNFY